jgi:hypothetical protein
MTNYRDIDEMLLTTNKGPFEAGPNPGDGVVVSFVGRGVREILVHYVDYASKLCRGETRDTVFGGDGTQLLGKADYVQFSTSKIAGINRR